jgi:hypothetical protein
LAADDQVEAVFVGVVDQRSCGLIAVDDLALDRDAGAVGAVADFRKAVLEVAACCLGGSSWSAVVSACVGVCAIDRAISSPSYRRVMSIATSSARSATVEPSQASRNRWNR